MPSADTMCDFHDAHTTRAIPCHWPDVPIMGWSGGAHGCANRAYVRPALPRVVLDDLLGAFNGRLWQQYLVHAFSV